MGRNLCSTSIAMFFIASVQCLCSLWFYKRYSRIPTILSKHKIEAQNTLAVQREIKHMFASSRKTKPNSLEQVKVYYLLHAHFLYSSIGFRTHGIHEIHNIWRFFPIRSSSVSSMPIKSEHMAFCKLVLHAAYQLAKSAPKLIWVLHDWEKFTKVLADSHRLVCKDVHEVVWNM